jgi:hypothetical protein
MVVRIYNKNVLSLGSLHLTFMAVIGIWFWSSPALFEAQQHDPISPEVLECTSISLLGGKTSLSSTPLRVVSLVIYAFFAVPGLNLLVPAALFLALHIVYYHFWPRDDAKPNAVPVYIGLIFLLAVNVIFMVDIETTITLHDGTDESNWTFGQTLAVLLLVLPFRDALNSLKPIIYFQRHKGRKETCTKSLKAALEDEKMKHALRMEQVKNAVKYADVDMKASGMSSDL